MNLADLAKMMLSILEDVKPQDLTDADRIQLRALLSELEELVPKLRDAGAK